jgi:hypothetical protein
MITTMIEALNSPERKRLGRVKIACRSIFKSIPAFDNATARHMVEKILEEAIGKKDYLEIAQYALFNIYFGPKKKQDPTDPLFLELAQYLTKMLNDYPNAEIKGVALATLANLGPFAIKYAMNSRRPDPVLQCLSSRNPFLRDCAKEAIDNVPQFQPEGKPILASKELATIRTMGHDVPAYQEAVHYELFKDGDKEIKGAGKKVQGKIVDSEVVGKDEDGSTITKQTIIIPGQN